MRVRKRETERECKRETAHEGEKSKRDAGRGGAEEQGGEGKRLPDVVIPS